MITYEKTPLVSLNGGKEGYNKQGFCLSTDTKPLNVPNGTILIEIDTSKIFLFDAENEVWSEWVNV